MTSREYDSMDEPIAAEIDRLHKKHPKLGHDGLMGALKQQGIQVNERQLKLYLRTRGIDPESPGCRTWGHVAAGYWIGGVVGDRGGGGNGGDGDGGDGGD